MGAWLSYNREFRCDTCPNKYTEVKSLKELFDELLEESDIFYPEIRVCPNCVDPTNS